MRLVNNVHSLLLCTRKKNLFSSHCFICLLHLICCSILLVARESAPKLNTLESHNTGKKKPRQHSQNRFSSLLNLRSSVQARMESHRHEKIVRRHGISNFYIFVSSLRMLLASNSHKTALIVVVFSLRI